MFHCKKSLSFLMLLCSVFWVHAITPFKDGDKVIFLGDSITHGGEFLYWVQAMYQLRQPGKIRVENAGISGDVASGGLARLGYDVLDKKPNRVFIMFGMNDINLSLYKKGGSDLDEKRMKPLKNYENNMNRICDRLKEAGVSITLITPTPYNQYVNNNPSTYNEVGLAAAAKIVRKTAQDRGLEMVEFHVPMTEMLKTHPKISPMRTDNVHPNSLGHLVMAYYFCKEAGLAGKIAEVSINAADGKIKTAKHAAVSELKIKKNGKAAEGISFGYAPERLPFIPNKKQHEGIDSLVPFTADFNTESLQISGLADGKYQLSANGAALGTYTSAELAKGINLAALNTPSRQQAQKIFGQINIIRSCFSRLRSVVQADRFAKSMNADLNDPESCCKAADQWFKARFIDKKGSNEKYFRNVITAYKKNKKQVPAILKQLDAAYVKLYQESHPVSYKLELKKM